MPGQPPITSRRYITCVVVQPFNLVTFIKTKIVRVDQRTLLSFSITGMADFLVKRQSPPRNFASLYRSDVIQVCQCFNGSDREKGQRHGGTLILAGAPWRLADTAASLTSIHATAVMSLKLCVCNIRKYFLWPSASPSLLHLRAHI